VNIERAFKYVFEDKQWVSKILIGVLLSLFAWLIIPAFILNGYMIAVIRKVMDGQETEGNTLPEWDDWGKLTRDGFFLTVAQFVYTLPFLFLLFVGFIATVGLGGTDSQILAAGLFTTWLVIGCLGLLLTVALLFLTPGLAIQYAIKDDFGACFRVREIWDIITGNMADILIVFVVTLLAGFVLSLVTGVLSIIPCLGWIAAVILSLAFGPYLVMVTGHLYGQIAAKVLNNKTGGDLPTAKIV
jgi:hypothetical protein